jgi:threonine aldolase
VTSGPAAPDRLYETEIDLRSDFASPSGPVMLAAMHEAAQAPCGFGFREGVYVKKLERDTSTILGKEDAIWLPTCTMANLVAVLLQTNPDGGVVAQGDTHIATTERGSIVDIAKRTLICLPPCNGLVAPEVFSATLSKNDSIQLIVLEDTHNRSGGLPLPIGYGNQIGAAAAEHGVKLHLDGARIFNSAVSHGVDPAVLCEATETVSISLNKGLGAPNGAMLAGPQKLIERASILRQQLGGGVRPMNLMAAAGITALQRWRDLSRDHQLAKRIAKELIGIPHCVVDLNQVQTNIILVRLELDRVATTAFAADLKRYGIGALDFDAGCIRLCVHCGILEDAVPRIAAAFLNVAKGMDWRDSQ